MNSVPQDYADMVDALNARQVEYVLVGAYAVGFHGYPRLSADFDILIRPTPGNVARANDALRDFGAPCALKLDDLTAGRWTQIGVKPVRIDLLGAVDGVGAEEVWAGRVRGRFGGREAWYISYELLIRNKLAAGRKKDLLDVDQLQKAKKARQQPSP